MHISFKRIFKYKSLNCNILKYYNFTEILQSKDNKIHFFNTVFCIFVSRRSSMKGVVHLTNMTNIVVNYLKLGLASDLYMYFS